MYVVKIATPYGARYLGKQGAQDFRFILDEAIRSDDWNVANAWAYEVNKSLEANGESTRPGYKKNYAYVVQYSIEKREIKRLETL